LHLPSFPTRRSSDLLYGAPFLCMHRADLHEALYAVLPPEIVHLNKKLVGLDQVRGQVMLSFADGTKAQADAVIGADGVHSLVRRSEEHTSELQSPDH